MLIGLLANTLLVLDARVALAGNTCPEIREYQVTAGPPYAADRDELLARIHQQLLADERIVATWLTGSLGRGGADEVSDIDLTAVISNGVADVLCERTGMVRAGAPPERLALFSMSAQPSIVHENHHNAPNSGTLSAVVYEESAVTVDWTLVPEDGACRPLDTVLLFERRPIPICRELPLPDQTERDGRIAERAAFFWMMIPQTIKSLYRNDLIYFHVLAHMLEQTRDELAALIREQPVRYRKGSKLQLSQTRLQGSSTILTLCREVMTVLDEYDGDSEIDGISGDPMSTASRLLQMLDESAGSR